MKNTVRILPKIQSPRDVRRLRPECLDCLAEEIRQTIIGTTAENGGHLASNLGMVETTIALHRVFESPEDTIVFDVSHQAYAHKLLTGRYPAFSTLRQAGGLSGFTNRAESVHDTVTAGHSGSAISTAIGIAEAKRLQKNRSWTVAVVGDGSFTNGMVYEALNQLAAKNLRLIIVLNDNEMSISKNVGGLSEYLAYIRTSEGYFNFKYHAKQIMEQVPLFGEGLVNVSRFSRDVIKRLTNSETWFESFGLEYIGPANGNNIQQMTNVLNEAKTKNCPVIVHIKTKKGLGYAPSEEHPERYHSIGAFKLQTADALEPDNTASVPAKRTFTQVAGEELVRAAERNGKICAITAAMSEGCGLTDFEERFPERFFDVGIAEEHAVTMAGGLALAGMLPVTVLYSTFAQRVFDQMWHDVALQGTKAIFLFSHAGLVPGDGITHQGIYDAALFSRIEGVRIYSPDTFVAWKEAFAGAMQDEGISIIRYPKGGRAEYPPEVHWQKNSPLNNSPQKNSPLNNSPQRRNGEFSPYKTCEIGCGVKNMLLLTYGRIAENVVKAAIAVSADRPGWKFTAVVLERIAPLPLDDELLGRIHAADKVLFVEEHIRSGGIAEALASDARVTRHISVRAIEDTRVPHGDLAYLMRYCGLDADAIAERIREEISRAGKFRIEME